MRVTRKLGFIAVPVMAIAALAGGALPASATTDGFPILYAGGEVHHCEILGAADGYQAVVCVDISTGYTDDGFEYYATGAVEAYCQTDAGVAAQCANIDLGGVSATGQADTEYPLTWGCGHAFGACPSDRKVLALDTYTYADGDCEGSAKQNLWVEAVGTDDYTQIELPKSDDTFTLSSSDGGNDGDDYSTGHYWVCSLPSGIGRYLRRRRAGGSWRFRSSGGPRSTRGRRPGSGRCGRSTGPRVPSRTSGRC